MLKLVVLDHKALFKIFDSLVVPILCYGSEVWGYEYHKNIEQVHINFANQSWELESMPQIQQYLVNVADCQQLRGTISKLSSGIATKKCIRDSEQRTG